MAEIHFLGTGGWVATPRRDNTSVLLRAGGKLTLIDCAGSVAAKFRQLKIDPRSVSAVILTHIHPDHTYGLPSLIHGLILEEGEIAVLGSEETVAFARRLLDLFELRERNVRTRVRFQTLRPGRVYRLHDALSLRCLRVPHHPSSLSYRFSLPEEKKEILFSGDTPVHRPLFEEARAIDYLVHEASGPARFFKKYPRLYEIHTSALDLGRWSQEAGVKCLIPCHFLADIWSLPAEVRAEIRRHFRGRLIVPRDLQCVPL